MKKILINICIFLSVLQIHGQNYYGDGSDGNLNLNTGSIIYTDGTRAQAISHIGQLVNLDPAYNYTDASLGAFNSGDKIILIQMEGGKVGRYEVADLVNGNSTSIELPAGVNLGRFDFNGVVQAIKVPQWNRVFITNGSLNCHGYDRHTGGILMFCAFDELRISQIGSIDASGKGYAVDVITNTGTGGSGGAGGLSLGEGQQQSNSANKSGPDADLTNGLYMEGDHSFILSTNCAAPNVNNGGAGSNPAPGSPGQNGFPGSNMSFEQFDTLLIMGNCGAGGNGGQGGQGGGSGGAGGNGGDNNIPGYQGQNGAKGVDGAAGGDGGNGGNGGGAIWIRAYRISNGIDTYIFTDGSNGANGSNGNGSGVAGQGGNGGDGGLGGCGQFPAASGGGGGYGRSGDGASAGDGGNGGDAGVIWINYYSTAGISSANVSLKAGLGGNGGMGAEPYSGNIMSGNTPVPDMSYCAQYCDVNRYFIKNCHSDKVFDIMTEMVNSSHAGNNYYFNNGIPVNTDGHKECVYIPSGTGYELSCEVTNVYPSQNKYQWPDEYHYTTYKTHLTDVDPGGCNIQMDALHGIVDGNPMGQIYPTWDEFFNIPSTGFDKDLDKLGFLPGYIDACKCDCVPDPDNGPKKGDNGYRGQDGDPGLGGSNPNRLHISQMQLFDNPVNMNEVEKINISIYPNPAKDFLIVKFAKEHPENMIFLVYDESGKICLKEKTKSRGNVNLNISELLPGAYVLKIIYNEQIKYINFTVTD